MSSSSSTVPHFYTVLGVDPSISAQELTRHYRKLSLELHPDRAAYRTHLSEQKQKEIEIRYQAVTEAYAVLSQPDKRAAYDTKHGVNFSGRINSMMENIRQHNENATQRNTATTSVQNGDGDDGRNLKRFKASSQNSENEDDEDDEDYEPEMISKTSYSVLESDKEDIHSSEEISIKKLFNVHTAANFSTLESCLRSVTLSKTLTLSLSSKDSMNSGNSLGAVSANDVCMIPLKEKEASWGITVDKNVIVDFDVCKYDSIIIPSRIVEIGTSLIDRDDEGTKVASTLQQCERTACDRLRRTYLQEMAQECKELGLSVCNCEKLKQPREMQCFVEVMTEYYIQEATLNGKFEVLKQYPKLLDELLPPSAGNSAQIALLPGTSVLSVNGEMVRSQEDLRNYFVTHIIGAEGSNGTPDTQQAVNSLIFKVSFLPHEIENTNKKSKKEDASYLQLTLKINPFSVY